MADPYANTPAAGTLHGTPVYNVDPVTGASTSATDPVGQVTLVDGPSITSATGASQQLLAANASRKALTIINVAATDWTIDPLGGTAAAGTLPGFRLGPGDSYSPVKPPTNKITGIGTAASKLVVLEG